MRLAGRLGGRLGLPGAGGRLLGLCANDSTGLSACEYLGGCRPEGELCRRETDCCGFNAGAGR